MSMLKITAEDLDFGGDSGTGSVDLDSQTTHHSRYHHRRISDWCIAGQTTHYAGFPDDATIEARFNGNT